MLKCFVLGLIKGYRMTARFRQWVLPPMCRFHPSCSLYAYQAIEGHGIGLGSWLTLKRLAKCHPLHPGGLDPVPPPQSPTFINQENSL